MATKDESRVSIRPSGKARHYLEELGYLDKRTGRKKKNALNLNKFINELIVVACESDKHPMRTKACKEELMSSYRKHLVAMRNREIARLQQEIQSIVDYKGDD